jgi:hypothetical protein
MRSTKDRLFWVWLSRIWSEWRVPLLIVKPDTVIGWHRKGFRLFWTRLSWRKIGGRPSANSQIRAMIKHVLYVFIVLAYDRRRVLRFNVTEHPTAAWTAQQIIETFPDETAPRFLLRDRDQIYGEEFRRRVAGMKIEEVITAARSPWQNAHVERPRVRGRGIPGPFRH